MFEVLVAAVLAAIQFIFFFNRHYITSLGFGLLNCRWVFSAGRFLQSAVPSGTSNPQLGGPVIRTFQLSPQGAPTVCSDASEPNSEMWNYGREMAENFAESGDIHVTFGFFYMPQIYDMGPTEGVLRIFSPLKIRRLRPGSNPQTWVPKASTLRLDHRSDTIHTEININSKWM